jgi:hypothetical protein
MPEQRELSFREALTKLAADPHYRTAVLEDPEIVTNDFRLSYHELDVLHEAAVLSGLDLEAVDRVRAKTRDRIEHSVREAGLALGDVSISSCCCCCCCG